MIKGLILKLISIAAFLIITAGLYSQYYSTGQDPASLKWMQVKTGRFRVIYPADYGAEGVEFARALERSFSDLSVLYPEKNIRIPVIIHNHTTQSNGYVAWAPKRMELYPTPDQNSIPLDQRRQLALHEMIHVLQMESLNSGFSKAMSWVAGEQFPGAMAAFLPLWFMEGEAVFAETLLSGSGRGRSPAFQNQLKALAVEKGAVYKYDKMLNGSYRNLIPDYYQYGYQMVTWSLLNNDPQLWNRVLGFTASQPFTLNPVNISLNRNAGLTKKKLFYQTFDTLTSLWKKDITLSGAIDYPALNPSRKTEYESYHSAVVAGNDSIIAVKTSLSDPPAIILIRPSEGREKKIFVPGSFYPRLISYADRKIVWVENRPDPRWDNRNYSVIMLYDINERTPRQLSFMSRYLAASISPDGKMIAASENTTDNLNNLVLVSSATGSIIRAVPVPGNAFIQRPLWSADGKKITVISLTEEGEGVLCYDLSGDNWSTLIKEDRDDLQSAYLRHDSLFYITSASGTDNVHILTSDGTVKRLTNSKFGTSDAFIHGDMLLFSNYTSSGNNICYVGIPDALSSSDELPEPVSYLIDRFRPVADVKKDPAQDFTPIPYRKWQHLFRIHSWMPFYADIEEVRSDPASIRPGFTLMSQNHLSTLTATAGYEYSADRRHKFHSQIIWEGWYPVVESRLDYGNEPVISLSGENPGWTPSPLRQGYRFHNNIYIPWYFSTGKYYQYIYPFLTIDYRNDYIYLKETGNYDYGQTKVTGRLYLANIHKSVYRDIYPRFGQFLDLAYENAPFDDQIYGSDLSFRSSFYFPGIFKNHGIRFRYESENMKFVKFLSSNKIDHPRGYDDILSRQLRYISFDYVAPLFYPDFNIASLLYITRVRAGLFYDRALGTDNYYLSWNNGSRVVDAFEPGEAVFSSFGFELLSDFHLLRIPYPVSAGVQGSWKSLSDKPAFEFIFNIDIYGMNIGRTRR